MNYRLIINTRARHDMQRIRHWYEKVRPTLGDDFYDEIIAAVDKISERPLSFPVVTGAIRGTRCKRFPYKIYFRVEGDLVRVTSIYHLRRKPKY